MSYPIFTVLPVGQGNCSMIEVYDHDPNGSTLPARLEFLAMVDCGVIARTKGGTDTKNVIQSEEYILKKMKERWRAKNPSGAFNETPYYLDVFLLTHQDNDHWFILNRIIADHVLKMQYKNWYKNDQFYYQREKSSYVEKITKYVESPTKQTEKIYRIFNISFAGIQLEEIAYSTFQTPSEKKYSISVVLHDQITDSLIEVTQQEGDFDLLINKVKDENSYPEHIRGGLDKIIEYIKKWSKEANQFIHQDVIKPESATVVTPIIGTFYYGGILYGPSALNFRYLIELLTGQKKVFAAKGAEEPVNDHIKFEVLSRLEGQEIIDTTKKGPEKVRILEASGGGEQSILKNASSAVTFWQVCGQKYLMTGDATVHTFYYLNQDESKLSECADCIMTAPHHGSDNTSKGKLCKRDGSSGTDDYEILSTFLKKVKPSAIAVSAGYRSEFQHPGLNFITKCMETFESRVPQSNPPVHPVYLFQERGDASSERFYELPHNLYTTVYAQPNLFNSTGLSPDYIFYVWNGSNPPAYRAVNDPDLQQPYNYCSTLGGYKVYWPGGIKRPASSLTTGSATKNPKKT